MVRVGVRELRQNLSVYLRRIRDDGEAFEVTDRGRPVAVLAPLAEQDDEYAAMEAAGLLRPAKKPWSTFEVPGEVPSSAVSDALEEQREERL